VAVLSAKHRVSRPPIGAREPALAITVGTIPNIDEAGL
jgi:hypothetical protein